MPSSWTTPARGITNRPLNLCLKVELDFSANPAANELRLWEIMERLLPILGDHPLTIDTLAEERTLLDNPRPWKAGRYSCNLNTTLATLTDRQLWLDIQPAFDHLCFIEVRRGTREQRHLVWWMKIDPQTGPYAPAFELAVCTAHVPKDMASDVEALVHHVFQIGATMSACVGGRAGHVEYLPDYAVSAMGCSASADPANYHPRDAAGLACGENAWRTRPSDQPLIPYIAHANFVPCDVLKKLGGAPRLRTFAEALSCDPTPPMFTVTDLPRGFANIQFGRFDVGNFASWIRDPSAMKAHAGIRWLAKEVAATGMFLFQDPTWEKQYLREVREARQRTLAQAAADRAAATRSRYREQSPAEIRDEMAYLWSHPPRCIRDVSVVARPTEAQRADHELHESTTIFWIRPNSLEEAFTVYGAPSTEEHRLSSPIHVGSLDPDRAVFTFDADTDGWDAESDQREHVLKRNRKRLHQLACPDCQGRMFKLMAAFEYPIDDDLKDDPKAWARRQDYFTWFWLFAYCATCPWNSLIVDRECA